MLIETQGIVHKCEHYSLLVRVATPTRMGVSSKLNSKPSLHFERMLSTSVLSLVDTLPGHIYIISGCVCVCVCVCVCGGGGGGGGGGYLLFFHPLQQFVVLPMFSTYHPLYRALATSIHWEHAGTHPQSHPIPGPT